MKQILFYQNRCLGVSKKARYLSILSGYIVLNKLSIAGNAWTGYGNVTKTLNKKHGTCLHLANQIIIAYLICCSKTNSDSYTVVQ